MSTGMANDNHVPGWPNGTTNIKTKFPHCANKNNAVDIMKYCMVYVMFFLIYGIAELLSGIDDFLFDGSE